MSIDETTFQKFHSHAYVKPLNNRIKIKTEWDIAKQLGIKVEKSNNSCKTSQVANDANSPHSASSIIQTELCPDEKKKLIENILLLKSENQALVQNFNEKDAQLKAKTKLMDEKVLEITLMLDESKTKLKNATQANEKMVIDLKRESTRS